MAGEWIVSQLIDSDTGGRNHHLVESLFIPFESILWAFYYACHGKRIVLFGQDVIWGCI